MLNLATTCFKRIVPKLLDTYFHEVVDLLLFFGSSLVQSQLLPNVQQLPLDHELLSFYPLGQLVVVDVDQTEFHRLFLLGIVVVELHLCQQQLGVVVVLDLEVSPPRHETDHLGWGVRLAYLTQRSVLLGLDLPRRPLLPLRLLLLGVYQHSILVPKGQYLGTLSCSTCTGMKFCWLRYTF